MFDTDATTTIDGKGLDEGTPDALAGTIDVEDLPILMSLLAERQRLGLESAAYLVLDEAEDFSVFELFVLGRLLSKERSCTRRRRRDAADRPRAFRAGLRCSRPWASRAPSSAGSRSPTGAPAHRGAGATRAGAQAAGLESTAGVRDAVPVGFHHFPELRPGRPLLARRPARSGRAGAPRVGRGHRLSSDAADTFYAGLSGLQRRAARRRGPVHLRARGRRHRCR